MGLHAEMDGWMGLEVLKIHNIHPPSLPPSLPSSSLPDEAFQGVSGVNTKEEHVESPCSFPSFYLL